MCCTLHSCDLLILWLVFCTFSSLCLFCPSSHPSLLWKLLVCSLSLWVCFCFVIFICFMFYSCKWEHTGFSFLCLLILLCIIQGRRYYYYYSLLLSLLKIDGEIEAQSSWVAWTHMASECQSRDSSPGPLAWGPMLLFFIQHKESVDIFFKRPNSK